jgi:hypothetical protein
MDGLKAYLLRFTLFFPHLIIVEVNKTREL